MRTLLPGIGGAAAGGLATALMTLFLMAFPQSAAADVTVSFDPLHGTMHCTGDTLEVSVTVDIEANDLRGFSLVFEFDPGIALPVSVSAGWLLTNAGCDHFIEWLNPSTIGDSIAVDAATLGCSMWGPGAIIDIRFIPLSPGVSYFRCREGTMRDSDNNNIPFTADEGTISFDGATPTEAGSWGRVKSLYR